MFYRVRFRGLPLSYLGGVWEFRMTARSSSSSDASEYFEKVSIMMSIILLLIMLSIIGQQSLDSARRATLPQFDIWRGVKDRLYVLCSSVERIVITGKVSEEFSRDS